MPTLTSFKAISYKHTYGQAGDLGHARRRQPHLAQGARRAPPAFAASASCSISSSPRRARVGPASGRSRSVVGTIDIDASDPLLEGATTSCAGCSTMSLRRPLMVKETYAGARLRAAKKRRAWLIRRPPSPTRTRSCSTPPAAASSAPRAAAFFDRCERREAILYVPAVVMWECSLLARVSRINLRRTVRAFFDDLFSNPAYQPLDVTPETGVPGGRAAIHARSVRRAHLRVGADHRPAAHHARRRDPRLRNRHGDLVIERTIAASTHGRYLVEPPGRAGAAPVLVGFHGYARGRRGAARTDARRFRRRTAGGWSPIQGCTVSTSAATNQVVASWMTRQDRELAIADNLRLRRRA